MSQNRLSESGLETEKKLSRITNSQEIDSVLDSNRERIHRILDTTTDREVAEEEAKIVKRDLEKTLRSSSRALKQSPTSSGVDTEQEWKTPWLIRLLFESPVRYIFYPLLPIIWVIDRVEWGVKKGVFGQRRQITESVFKHPQQDGGVSTIQVHPGYRDQYLFSIQMIDTILNSWQMAHPDKEIVSHSFDITTQAEEGELDTGFDNLMNGAQLSIVWKNRSTPLSEQEIEYLEAQTTAEEKQEIEEFKKQLTPKEFTQFEKMQKQKSALVFPVVQTQKKNRWALWRYLSLSLGAIPFGLRRLIGRNKAIHVSHPISLGDGEKQVTLSISKSLTDTFLKDNSAVVNEAIGNWVARHPEAEITRIDGGRTFTIRYKEPEDIPSPEERENSAKQYIPKGVKQTALYETDDDMTMYKPIRKIWKYMNAPLELLIHKGLMGGRRRAMVQNRVFEDNPNQGVSALSITSGIRDYEVPRGTVIQAAIESWKNENPDKDILDIGDDEHSTVSLLWKKIDPPRPQELLQYQQYHFPLKESKRKNEWALWRYLKLGLQFPTEGVLWLLGFPMRRVRQSGGEVDLGNGKKRDNFYMFDSLLDETLNNSAFSITDSMVNWKKGHPTADMSDAKISISDDNVIINYSDSNDNRSNGRDHLNFDGGDL